MGTISIILYGLCTLVIGGVAFAADISRSLPIESGQSVLVGDLISASGDSDTVVPADSSNGARLLGAAIPSGSASVAIGSNLATNVQVAVSGTASVFVSTINGDVHAGDSISVSPLKGIGMKTEGTLRTIGIAQADLTSHSPGAAPYSVTDKGGTAKRVYIGSMPVVIAIGNGTSINMSSGIAGGLQGLAEVLVGHQVSTLQALASVLITIAATGAVIALVYGSIRSSIIAAGRNPLARETIFRSLAGVLAMAALIVFVAVAALDFTLR